MHQKHLPFKKKSAEQLWIYRMLGKQNPESLLCALWYLLTLHCGYRGCQEHNDMFVKDFRLKKDDQGTEYVTFEENRRKTRQGGLRKRRRAIQPVCQWRSPFSCPVLKNISCPQTWRNAKEWPVLSYWKKKSEVPHKKQRTGANKIYSFMKDMALESEYWI